MRSQSPFGPDAVRRLLTVLIGLAAVTALAAGPGGIAPTHDRAACWTAVAVDPLAPDSVTLEASAPVQPIGERYADKLECSA